MQHLGRGEQLQEVLMRTSRLTHNGRIQVSETLITSQRLSADLHLHETPTNELQHVN